MIDLLEAGLHKAENIGVNYAELRYLGRRETDLIIKNGKVDTSLSGFKGGLAVRCMGKTGGWGFATTYELAKDPLLNAVEAACTLAKNSSSKGDENLADTLSKTETGLIQSPMQKSLDDVSLEEKLSRLIEADQIARGGDRIKSSTSRYREFIERRIILTTIGANVEIHTTTPELSVSVVAVESGARSPARYNQSRVCGAEFWSIFPPEEIAQKAREQSIRLLNARHCPAGDYQVILDHDIVGLLAHEAVGHCAEADNAAAGSYLEGKLNQPVAAEIISMTDAPTGKSSCWVPVDDEGIQARPVAIVENGMLKEFMTNLSYAVEFDSPSTGNARAWSFDEIPLIRMRNTFIESGDHSFEELLESVRNGLFIRSGLGGQADSSGEFMFGFREAQPIMDGELKEDYLQGSAISGNAFDVLKAAFAVSKAFKLDLRGLCGKGQYVKIDAGGAQLGTTARIGGR